MTFFRRLGHDLDLGHAFGALPQGSADTVGTGIAAADDHDFFAFSQNILPFDQFSGNAAVLLVQIVHREMDTVKFPSRNRKVTRSFRAVAEADGVKSAFEIAAGNIFADFDAGFKAYAFRRHQVNPALNDGFGQFEIRNAVAEQAADAGGFSAVRIDVWRSYP